MKLPLHLLLLTPASSLLPSINHISLRSIISSPRTVLQYKPTDEDNVFNVLANTERWISQTLDKSNESAKKAKQMHFADDKTPEPISAGDNPYARKEVSYSCETGSEVCKVVGGIFKRVREARELGERFGAENGGKSTMRQTNVVVIPNCDEMADFQTFDRLVRAINTARRTARDLNYKKSEDDNNDWVVSINCAHLHPQYGVESPEHQLQAMKDEESEGEVDLNLKEYKRRRMEARRSPYPSVIVEVMASPAPDYTPPAQFTGEESEEGQEPITSNDIARLNAIFNMKPADFKQDADFYEALGDAFGDNQLSAQTPMSMAQNWVLANDPAFNEATSTFTTSDTRHVDKAYEYVFNTLAMTYEGKPTAGQRSYIVLPEFLPNSSYSFARFADLVNDIVDSMPSMKDKMTISTFHPEHLDGPVTSPIPILVITWN